MANIRSLSTMYLPAKPNPLGIGAKTAMDSMSGVIINFGLIEGREVDNYRELCEYDHHVATIPKLAKLWFGCGRYTIANSGFGSYRCCHALIEKRLYSIKNIKNNYKQPSCNDIQSL